MGCIEQGIQPDLGEKGFSWEVLLKPQANAELSKPGEGGEGTKVGKNVSLRRRRLSRGPKWRECGAFDKKTKNESCP